MPLHLLSIKTTVRNAWQALSDHYNGVGALDASILSAHLHQFQLDNSKSLELQINLMHDMQYQLASLGDVLMDAKFAMVISEVLPPSYDTLKTLTVAMVTDASQITTNTLITQILREERQKENQYSMAALFVKPRRSSAKITNPIPNSTSNPKSNPKSKSNCLKSKKGKPRPCCTNPKCMRIGHTIECCWAEGGGSEGQQPVIPGNSQPGNTSSAKDSGKKDGKVAVLIAQDCAALVEHDHSHSFEWVVDSSASSHICTNNDWFSSYSVLNPPCPIILGDKCVIHAIGQGQIDITIQNSPVNR